MDLRLIAVAAQNQRQKRRSHSERGRKGGW